MENLTMKYRFETGPNGNYYGGLCLGHATNGKFYWAIENYNGCHWEECPETMFRALYQHEYNREYEDSQS